MNAASSNEQKALAGALSTFTELAKLNVNQHTEKKGNLTYLSWAWAVDQLLRHDDAAVWEYRFHDGKPYVQIGDTCMVFCTVRAFGKERTAQLPVMDHKNKAIINPDAMAVNTAMQRCLAKAIALHGIGLYIYAGEDLPNGEPLESKLSDDVRTMHIKAIDEAPDTQTLKDFYMTAYKAADAVGDTGSLRLFEQHKDARKKALAK